MIVPVQNIVETVDLTPKDALLPLFESIVNSIISLLQSSQINKEIQIKIIRGELPSQISIDNQKTIESIIVSDNGIGFTNKNFQSFETPFSKTLKDYGCKGIGRFTILAAFKSIRVRSNYFEDNKWMYREFTCDAENEVTTVKYEISDEQVFRTSIELLDCFNPIIKDNTALSIESISNEIMQHCLIYYLSGELPTIKVFDTDDNKGEVINELFERVSKEHERIFIVGDETFKARVFIKLCQKKFVKDG